MEDQPEGRAATGPQDADAVSERCSGPSPRRSDRAIASGEDQSFALPDEGGGRTRLGPHAVFDDDELPAAVIGTRFVETDDDLQRKNEIPVKVAM